MNGSDILVMLDFGTEGAADYRVVGCQRDATFEEVSDTIDESCKAQRSQQVDAGRYSSTLSLDMLYVTDRDDLVRLRNANRNGDKIILARRKNGAIVQRASAKIDSFAVNFPDQAESVASLACTIDGFITEAWVIGEGIIGSVFIA